jgi:hypothetical protein
MMKWGDDSQELIRFADSGKGGFFVKPEIMMYYGVISIGGIKVRL